MSKGLKPPRVPPHPTPTKAARKFPGLKGGERNLK